MFPYELNPPVEFRQDGVRGWVAEFVDGNGARQAIATLDVGEPMRVQDARDTVFDKIDDVLHEHVDSDRESYDAAMGLLEQLRDEETASRDREMLRENILLHAGHVVETDDEYEAVKELLDSIPDDAVDTVPVHEIEIDSPRAEDDVVAVLMCLVSYVETKVQAELVLSPDWIGDDDVDEHVDEIGLAEVEVEPYGDGLSAWQRRLACAARATHVAEENFRAVRQQRDQVIRDAVKSRRVSKVEAGRSAGLSRQQVYEVLGKGV
ncbi:hypothetical protein [Corynebacterium nuruki]|uniref:hypothetical protein n=1 Tax=Corynebacterium nuruki TaxID=1032851 RepID=UPI0039BF8842